MDDNEELRRAWDFAEYTHTSIFLTGKAGTGKTTFLRRFRSESTKTIAVVAPTGVAAINAGGVTIHSFFQLPLSPYVPGTEVRDKFSFSREKLRIIRMLDMLVIDEISMVRSDLLDAVDNALRKYRRDSRPFGGVQLLMIGDLQQLTPITTPQEEELLAPYYSTPYFFGSRALQKVDYVTIELSKVYRQQNGEFLQLLNHIRTGELGDADRQLLNSRYKPAFIPPKDSDYIRLTTHNAFADRYNADRLARIGEPATTFYANVEGTFPESSYPTAPQLTLKVGAQVMFVRNDPSGDHKYYNGKIGRVVELDLDHAKVMCTADSEPIEVGIAAWENTRYQVDNTTGELREEVQGTFKQLPLRLAWAITIHKSQGLTFDHAVVDAGASFAPGQVYVALSRCKSLEGMVLATPITPGVVLTDERVSDYVNGQHDAAQRSIERLPAIKEEYFRNLLCELFAFGPLGQSEERLARFVGEHMRRSYPAFVNLHRDLLTEMRTQVFEVADKWLPMLRRMTIEELHSEATLQRVGRSAGYFRDALLRLFEPVFKGIEGVRIANRTTATHFRELVVDLHQSVKSRLLLLDAIAQKGFTIANYLNSKKHALAVATSAGTPKLVRPKSQRVSEPAAPYASKKKRRKRND